MAKEKKAKKLGEIDITKLITQEEMSSIIAVIKSRQEFFQKLALEKRTAKEKGMSALRERFSNIENKEAKEKIELLAEKLMVEADRVYLKNFAEELKHQSGMVEFLHRFTNEKFEDLTGFFSL